MKLLQKLIFAIAGILVVAVVSQAQPNIAWVRTYDFRQDRDEFFDLYCPTNDGGFALCGRCAVNDRDNSFWLVKLDRDGEVEWQNAYPFFLLEDNLHELSIAYSVIQTDDGGYLLGGVGREGNGIMRFSVIKTDRNGELEWVNFYGDMERNSECYSVIELKAGQYVMAGYTNGAFGYAVMTEGDGEVIWERNFGMEYPRIVSVKETEGGLVYAGGASIWKTDFDGELIWRRSYQNAPGIKELISCPEEGFAAVAASGMDDRWYLLRVNDEGVEMWHSFYEFEARYYTFGQTITRTREGGFILAGQITPNDDRRHLGVVLCADDEGNEVWRRFDDLVDDNIRAGAHYTRYYSSRLGGEGEVYIAGSVYSSDENDFDGILVKIVPLSSPPLIRDFSPAESELTILRGNTVTFSVYATDLQDDSLSYLWTLDGDSVGNDTFWVHTFDELDTNLVKCVVSDSTGADSAMWTVNVVELFISDKSPAESNLLVQRSRIQQFSIVVSATEDEEPVEMVWELDGDPVGEGDTLLYRFNLPHEHDLLAIASRGEYADSAYWMVDVRSVISRWQPVQDSLSIWMGRGIEFWVAPFNPESDSLTYLWTLDGDSVWNDQLWFNQFNQAGDFEVVCQVWDGDESDSVFWTVDVQNLEVDNDGRDSHPTRFVLYPIRPNPFNSTSRVTFSLPQVGQTFLSVHDLSGRLVQELYRDVLPTGMHQVQLDASDLPAGVYIIRLQSFDGQGRPSCQALQKAVVVK